MAQTLSDAPTRSPGWKLPLASYLGALVFTIIPLPAWLHDFRPDWVALAVIYWCIYTPLWFGIGAGWVAGLLQDAVQFGLLGGNALCKSVIAYLANRGAARIQHLGPVRQTIVVLGLLILNLFILSLIRWLTQRFFFSMNLLTSTAAAALCWPLIVFIFNRLTPRRPGQSRY